MPIALRPDEAASIASPLSAPHKRRRLGPKNNTTSTSTTTSTSNNTAPPSSSITTLNALPPAQYAQTLFPKSKPLAPSSNPHAFDLPLLFVGPICPDFIAPLTLTLHPVAELSAKDFAACFDLIASTSKSAYQASEGGWNARRKKAEMRQRGMWALVLRQFGDDSADEARTQGKGKMGDGEEDGGEGEREELGEVQGFCSFMLTHDDDDDDDGDEDGESSLNVDAAAVRARAEGAAHGGVPVIYIYEIHLAAQHRRSGLGTYLVKLVEQAGRQAGAEKAMLTVFLGNEGARKGFYRKGLGWKRDAGSPVVDEGSVGGNQGKGEGNATRRKLDRGGRGGYEILSKDLWEDEAGEAASGRKRKASAGTRRG